MLLPSDIFVCKNIVSPNEAWAQLEHELNQHQSVYPGRALYAPYVLQADALRMLAEHGLEIDAAEALLVLQVWQKRAYSTMLKFRDLWVLPQARKLGLTVQPLVGRTFALLGASLVNSSASNRYGVLLYWSPEDLRHVESHAHSKAMEAAVRDLREQDGFFRGLETRIALKWPEAGMLIAETWQSKAAWETEWRVLQPILEAHGFGLPAIVEVGVPPTVSSERLSQGGPDGFSYVSPRRLR